MSLQKVIKHIPNLLFAFVILILCAFFFYRLTDQKLSPQARLLLVSDGLSNSELRQRYQKSDEVIILPRDSIFDHQKQVQEIERKHHEFKNKIENQKSDFLKIDLQKTFNLQIKNSLESLYSINPISLMSLNLEIIQFCLTQMKLLSIPVDQEILGRLKDLEVDSLFLRAARFHAQSVLGSIDVLNQSSFLMKPSLFLIQKQRLFNLLAQISLDPHFKTQRLSGQMPWYDAHQYELIYAQLFKKLIYDSKIDLKSQVIQIRTMIGVIYE